MTRRNSHFGNDSFELKDGGRFRSGMGWRELIIGGIVGAGLVWGAWDCIQKDKEETFLEYFDDSPKAQVYDGGSAHGS